MADTWPKARLHLILWLAAAFVWSAAEAFAVIIVADVLLTLIALRVGPRVALLAALVAALGALVGGAALYVWAENFPGAVRSFLIGLPAIDAAMVDGAGGALSASPLAALLKGAVTGVPFKVFAAAAPQAGLSVGAFLMLGFIARLARYVGAVVLATLAVALIPALRDRHTAMLTWMLFWVGFYGLYWGLMPA